MVKKRSAGGENIRVVVRKRPLSTDEQQQGDSDVVEINAAMSSLKVTNTVHDDNTNRYSFDAVYDDSFSQRQIFDTEVSGLVSSVINGYNATIFAYGQSGSGKTYTMTGDVGTESAGLMPNAVDAIFNTVKELETPQRTYRLLLTFIELYNGKVYDLTNPKRVALQIRNFAPSGMSTHEVSTPSECMELFRVGSGRRATAETGLNKFSSRSHAIFSINVVSTDHDSDPGSPIVVQSKLNLCDLAGSERLGKTGVAASGEVGQQGCNINLSLAALGLVIDNIINGNKHVPYRSSPLTMLLKDSLGGNSKTLMFANVGPARSNLPETINTLRFANRAKQIQNKPVKNLDPKDQLITQLKAEIELLKGNSTNAGRDIDSEESLKDQLQQVLMEKQILQESINGDKVEFQEELKHQTDINDRLKELVQQSEQKVSSAEGVIQQQLHELETVKDESRVLRSSVVSFLAKVSQSTATEATTDADPSSKDIFPLMDECYDKYLHLSATAASVATLQQQLADSQQDATRILKEKQASLTTAFNTERERYAEENKTVSMELRSALTEGQRIKEKLIRNTDRYKKQIAAAQEELHLAKKQSAELVSQLEQQKLDHVTETVHSIEDISKKHDAERSAERGKLQQQIHKIEEEKTILNSKIADLDRIIAEFRTAGPATEGDAAPTEKDGFTDVTNEIQSQLRLQCTLHRLRHNQEKHLSALISKYRLAANDHRTMIPLTKHHDELESIKTATLNEQNAAKAQLESFKEKLLERANVKLQKHETAEKEMLVKVQVLEDENIELTNLLDKMENELKKYGEEQIQFLEAEKKQQVTISQQERDITEYEHQIIALKKELSETANSTLKINELEKGLNLTTIALKEQRDHVTTLQLRITAMNDLLTAQKEQTASHKRQSDESSQLVKETEAHYESLFRDHSKKMTTMLNLKLSEQQASFDTQLQERREVEKTLREKVKKQRNSALKAKQKFDEMVLENETIQNQFEEFKISTYREGKQENDLLYEDGNSRIRSLVKDQQQERKQQIAAFTGTGSVRSFL